MCGVARKTIEMLEVKMIRIKALADESGVKICLILIEVGCCELSFTVFVNDLTIARTAEEIILKVRRTPCMWGNVAPNLMTEHEKITSRFPLYVIC